MIQRATEPAAPTFDEPEPMPLESGTADAGAEGLKGLSVQLSAHVRNPFTGSAPDSSALLERRPLAIKISNYPRDIRPQYGLNTADVVYEYYIEWGYTRFIGIFYGADAIQIGPVRSGRYFDEHIVRMYQAYYVFNYADPREYAYYLGGDLRPFMVVPGYGSCPPFFQHRVSSLIADVRHYETYFNSERFADCQLQKGIEDEAPSLRATYFTPSPPAGGIPVERIFTHYSRCDYNYWAYQPVEARYMRFQESGPSTDSRYLNDCSDSPRRYDALSDALSGEQVSADNIVVVYVSHTFANANEQSDEIYHIDLIDSGRAVVFRDGVAFAGRWVRTDLDQPLIITTPEGTPLGLREGRTFFQVVGETSAAWSEGTDWQFEFHTP